jgi:magnesium chelatase subunit I
MTDTLPNQSADTQPGPAHLPVGVRSLRDLIERVAGRGLGPLGELGDAGVAEVLPFPFLAIVGQLEMKLALLLALVNPTIGGVLLIGPRGAGKTTAVRSLVDLLPQSPHSLCYYGCTPEDIETGGIDAVCPDCAHKYAQGEPLTRVDRVRLVELPLNARLEDVVGGIDERAAVHERMRLRRGILSHADRKLLYVDEVNLLTDDVVDAILDAAAQGIYTVRRGPVAATYRARFTFIGSMNPEEGKLRPQIMDRFGLRVIVHGLSSPQDRLEVYRRVQAYLTQPRQVLYDYFPDTEQAKADIQAARDRLPQITLSDSVASLGLALVHQFKIDSLRAEITMFEAARAYAAIDGRDEVLPTDLRQVAPMALRLRRSAYMAEYFSQQGVEETELTTVMDQFLGKTPEE